VGVTDHYSKRLVTDFGVNVSVRKSGYKFLVKGVFCEMQTFCI